VAPFLEKAFLKRHKCSVGVLWLIDETYLKIKGLWVDWYRAVSTDERQAGQIPQQYGGAGPSIDQKNHQADEGIQSLLIC
jgi:hypothetical protein